jgi:hexosaminidase
LEKDTQIQIWRDTDTIAEDKKWHEYLNDIVKDGYKAILSSPWYINFVSYGYKEWFTWYEVEPFANFTGKKKKLNIKSN